MPRTRAIAATLLAMLLTAPAGAHIENADPALAEWFESLSAPDTSIPCCNLLDCHPVPSRQVLGEWEAWHDQGWVHVPPEKVLTDTPNPLNSAVLCWSPSLGLTCFVPPPAGHRRNRGA